jgi:hypothetical protein
MGAHYFVTLAAELQNLISVAALLSMLSKPLQYGEKLKLKSCSVAACGSCLELHSGSKDVVGRYFLRARVDYGDEALMSRVSNSGPVPMLAKTVSPCPGSNSELLYRH